MAKEEIERLGSEAEMNHERYWKSTSCLMGQILPAEWIKGKCGSAGRAGCALAEPALQLPGLW